MATVQNQLSRRCKTLRLLRPGVYEYGWLVSDRTTEGHFTRAGEGTLDAAQEWMARPVVGMRRTVFRDISRRT